ncbi:MAG: asparagine synthase (glutamine-hydrolyzing) [Nitrospirota bacterium]
MCGICGKLNFDKNKDIDKGLIKKMCDTIVHRGPDDEGYYINKNIGLGMRRLSIIDLNTGHQPISNENQKIWIVFNGEIYNYRELKQDLIKKGHQFKTGSDTEAIIHLYEEYDVDCLKLLRGMFAFAIWDEVKSRLFLARDRVGKKPLIYTVANNSIIFASELKAIIQDNSVKKEIDFDALDQYMSFQFVPAPYTIFKGINKLPPASYLLCEKGNITVKRYWELDFNNKIIMSEDEYAEGILRELEDAVKLRMISDVPLGALLSGGIDSSAVVAIMARLSDKPIKTFSIGFEEEEYSEIKYARVVAERFKTEHHEFIVKPNIIEILPELTWYYDEPFADKSAVPSYYVAKEAGRHLKVVLNGDGGDEAFAGYGRYDFGNNIASLLPSSIKRQLIRQTIKNYFKISDRSKLASKMIKKIALNQFPVSRSIIFPEFFSGREKYNLYNHNTKDALNNSILNKIDELLEGVEDIKEPIDSMINIDFNHYLSGDLLVKMDIASMANSLEARSPFLDQKLLEFSMSIPCSFKIKNGERKYILKRALSDILPDGILNRNKMGFSIPLIYWLRNELKGFAYQTILNDSDGIKLFFNLVYVKQLLDEHASGKKNHALRIWSLIVFEMWYRRFMKGNIKEI